ncbi:hypothetical protein PR048_010226 [Dryococelus australis]|uniref:Uncharacterized protein n=1 Tax=Dryococelus australis TaxID=614101 RepID=A0ABQ9I251_9NEOP|nr:hypothetical protein PR048_010226 [Dryococelus australis]
MLKNQLKCCMQKCLAKLSNHMAVRETNAFYQAVRELFNRSIAGQKFRIDVKVLESNKKNLPFFFPQVLLDKFIEGYGYFHSQLVSSVREGSENIDCVQLLLAVKLRCPELAEVALRRWAPVSRVDAERFFSR